MLEHCVEIDQKIVNFQEILFGFDIRQGLLYLDGRNSQKYLHQDQAYF